MRKKTGIALTLLAGISAVVLGAPCRAAGILDQQLGPASPPPVAPAPTPAPPTAKPAPAAPANPSAEKAVDDADLLNQLLHPGAEKAADPKAQLKEMLDRMGQSQERLTDKDPGAVTQETQRRIITDLDEVIEYVRQQQQKPSKSSKKSDQQAEKRQMSQGQKEGAHQDAGNTAAKESQLSEGTVDAPESNGQDMRQKGPAEWGGLPPKDRDLIANGVNEQYLPAYKDMIDRYYQALAEVGKSKEK